jgi:predicted nucleic acid-binding protein
VLIHRLVIGEIACGSLSDRQTVLGLSGDLPMAAVAEADELLGFIERHRLWGKDIGHVDAHRLAAVALAQGAVLWTRDRRLRAAAESLKFVFKEAGAH